MNAEALSKNEMLTMYGLVRYPTYNDRVLANEIKLKMSTVTAIRNRLKREGYFRTVRVPYLERLGGELLVVTTSRLNILKPREELLRALKDIVGSIEDVFYAIADQNHLVMFSMCRNYTDAWTDAERSQQLLTDKGVLAGRTARQQTVIFPLNQTKLLRFFDFSRILTKLYGLEYFGPEPQVTVNLETPQPRRLSRIEKRVFLGLVRHPDLVDNDVAKRIGVTRQSVTKIRKRLESEGLLATVRVPDIQKTGMEILAVSRYEALPGATVAARKKGIEGVFKEAPSFFHVAGQREGMVMGLAGSFRELQKRQYEASRMYLERGYFKDEPTLTMLSVPDLSVVKDFAFAPLVKKVLQMEDEK
jgi:DNA-binding MarR family transcriptional regulator